MVGYEGNCSCVLERHHYNPNLLVPGTCTIPAGSVGEPCVVTWSTEVSGGLNVPHVAMMKINMGENSTTAKIPEQALEIWTGRKMRAVEVLRPHASLLYKLPYPRTH
eukprot:SAG11_NODE_10296_length_841_cov_1.594340_1_plen_107_part_00